MDIELFGLEQDLKAEGEKVKKYYEEYLEINKLLGVDENKYDSLLLEYGTEDLKYSLSLMTNSLRNVEKKGYKVIDPIFDGLRSSGEFSLGIFIANRIIEKYKEYEPNSAESYLIRLHTLKNAIDLLSIKNDKLYYLKYLTEFIDELYKFIKIYPSYLEEIYILGTNFYSFLYIYSLTIEDNVEKALGFIIKLYNLRKRMFEKGILKYPYEHNIYYLINIILVYFRINDELVKLSIDIYEYINDLENELRTIKNFIEKAQKYRIILSDDLKKYINEVLATLYSVGFEEEYNRLVSIFPDILTKYHRLIIKLYEIDRLESFEAVEKLEKIKEEIDRAFNNLSKEKREIISFLFFNTYLNHIEDEDTKKLKEIREELEKLTKKYDSLNVIKAKLLLKYGERDKAKEILEREKEKAIISGNKALQKIIDDYLSSEF